MAEGEKKKSAAPGPSRSTASSRAAQRRVNLPDGAKQPPAQVRVVRPPRPFWRRGGFWFAVIVAEAVGAVGLSYLPAFDPDTISLDGGDQAAFCDQIRQYQSQGAPGATSLDLTNVKGEFGRQAEAYRRLAPVAPDDVRRDFEKVARLTDEIVRTADEVTRRKEADPGYLGGLGDISTKQGEISARAYRSINRINSVVLQACGIDLTAPAPVPTTAAPTPPGSSPSGPTPGTTPGTTPGPVRSVPVPPGSAPTG